MWWVGWCSGGGQGGGEEEGAEGGAAGPTVMGLREFSDTLASVLRLPVRDASGPFYMAVDHCFPIKGQVREASPGYPRTLPRLL